jgi:hypothetical protein
MSAAEPPPILQRDTVEARIIKQKIWQRCNVQNEHFMAAVCGREGSGKSYTGLKLAECVDPTFTADRVMFSPEKFLRRLKEWKENNDTTGKAVVTDEAGVGVGVRTWYDRDQILFNQVLQVVRDENLALIFTLPRLTELDSQTRGRLHAFIEMTDKEDGEWAEFKWLNWDPTCDERDKIYRERPQMKIDGFERPVERLKISPPSSDLVAAYESRKEEFQSQLYADALDEMTEDLDDEQTVREIAAEIVNGRLGEYAYRHSQNNQPYLNKELIRGDYELSLNDAKAVKSLIEREVSDEKLEELASDREHTDRDNLT